jgi:hypothetical protein
MATIVALVFPIGGCIQSWGLSGAGISPLGACSTAAVVGVAARSELRWPRTYEWYAMTEAMVGSELALSNVRGANSLRPAERIGLGTGTLQIPSATRRIGMRGGVRLDLWHGALGASSAAWAGTAAVELAPIFRISRPESPWLADSTFNLGLLVIPSVTAGPLWRFDASESSRLGLAYSFTISFAASLSTSFVP